MRASDVFWRFLLLGCTSFGGPAAHLGYFHREFVQRLNWLSADEYGKLVALSQLLPGPGSSQVGFAIGRHRAGLAGAIAAFTGFTLPAFLLMFGLASFTLQPQLPDWLVIISQGLKLLAVVVVSDAVINMFRQYCQRGISRCLALISTLVLVAYSSSAMQFAVLGLAALLALAQPARFAPQHQTRLSTPPDSINRPLLAVFALLFGLSLWLIYWPPGPDHVLLSMAAQFYHSGSLVFGGGHVVLPLLQENVAGSLSEQQFLLGYAAAQGVPGPMFSLASYLGATMTHQAPLSGALIATVALFLPGLLLMFTLQQHWQYLSAKPRISAIAAALNAAVVGLLFSALLHPLLSSAVDSYSDSLAVLVGLLLLRGLSVPIWLLIAAFISYAWLGL